MTLNLKAGGWDLARQFSIKSEGVWKPATKSYLRDGGVWKLMYSGDPQPGDAMAGGFWFGRMTINSQVYDLIVADASTRTSTLWSSAPSDYAGVSPALISGWEIWNAINLQGSGTFEAAVYCDGLNSGGFTDWYLPSRWELDILYRTLKPGVAANVTNIVANPYMVAMEGLFTGQYTTSNPPQTANPLFKTGGAQALPDSTARIWTISDDAGQQEAITKTFNTGGEQMQPWNIGATVVPIRRQLAVTS